MRAEKGVDEEVVKEVDGVAHHANGGCPAVAEYLSKTGSGEDAPEGKEEDKRTRADFEMEINEDEDRDPSRDADEVGEARSAIFAEVPQAG